MGAISAIVVQILVSMVGRLMTEEFVSAFVVHTLAAMAEKSGTKLDDELVADVAKALAVSVEK